MLPQQESLALSDPVSEQGCSKQASSSCEQASSSSEQASSSSKQASDEQACRSSERSNRKRLTIEHEDDNCDEGEESKTSSFLSRRSATLTFLWRRRISKLLHSRRRLRTLNLVTHERETMINDNEMIKKNENSILMMNPRMTQEK